MQLSISGTGAIGLTRVKDRVPQINIALSTLPAVLRSDCAADLQGSDGGISIRGQVWAKLAGPCSQHVEASASVTLHISQNALLGEFIFMLAGKAIFFVCFGFFFPASANPFSCSFQGSTVNWLACWMSSWHNPCIYPSLGTSIWSAPLRLSH